ncbi:MAG TPA: HAD-IC family P-type ATPase, partial [Acholeplasma sp.]
PDTIDYFKKNGVDVKVISGDNPLTVSRISQRAGIPNAENYISLEGLSDKEVVRVANKYSVFGRVSPHQKKLLIESMKNNGHIVAMTGDGVNDILALKEADTSVAMASGSEAARNVSHLVLMDSNFASMPKVVTEGRRVINNIQRVSKLYLTKTLFTLFLAITTLIRGGRYPITPLQLSIMEFLVIAVPSFVLALEYNNNRVTGKFLTKIIKDTLPGALTVLINALIIYAMAGVVGLDFAADDRVISTLIVITATAVGFMVLFTVSVPLNLKRSLVFFVTLTISAAVIIFLPKPFNFVPFFNLGNETGQTLTAPQILLLVFILYTSIPMIYVLTNIGRWLKTVTKKAVKIISDMK